MVDQRIRVSKASGADPGALSTLLREAYGPRKSRFIMEHGAWWYRGDNVLVASCDDELIGYDGLIPLVFQMGGDEHRAMWGVDLYVSPRFRRRGVQKVLTDAVMSTADTHLVFPNELSAIIYRKQGGTIRDDLRLMLLPLHPRAVRSVRRTSGGKGLLLRSGALGLSPWASMYRARARRYRCSLTGVMSPPDPMVLEEVFRTTVCSDLVTTVRSAEFLRWRYLEAPYLGDLRFYVTRRPQKPTHYAIVRYLIQDTVTVARVLDIFGDLGDETGMADLLRTVVKEAVLRGATQVTAMACLPELSSLLRRAGFLFSSTVYFGWESSSPIIKEGLVDARLHWTLGDSDNDSPR
jgi:GNAT superfamily N-acetyltransferase